MTKVPIFTYGLALLFRSIKGSSAAKTPVPVTGAAFTVTLDGSTVTTFVGK